MLNNVIQTVVEDVQQSVANMFPVDNPTLIDKVKEHIEVVVLNSFYKHGIFPKNIHTSKGEVLRETV